MRRETSPLQLLAPNLLTEEKRAKKRANLVIRGNVIINRKDWSYNVSLTHATWAALPLLRAVTPTPCRCCGLLCFRTFCSQKSTVHRQLHWRDCSQRVQTWLLQSIWTNDNIWYYSTPCPFGIPLSYPRRLVLHLLSPSLLTNRSYVSPCSYKSPLTHRRVWVKTPSTTLVVAVHYIATVFTSTECSLRIIILRIKEHFAVFTGLPEPHLKQPAVWRWSC